MMKPSQAVFPIIWALAFVAGMSYLQTGISGNITASTTVVKSVEVNV